ncbi:MAG TPA: PAS domain-containing protein, partial [Thermoanaerobaculia bacterium]|nr:PAS domain-containing protein [Thermoanaerobaculia bacterium]
MIRPKTVSVSATRPAAVGVLGACVMAVVFLVDLATPLGYLDGILYTIPVLLGLWVPGARYALSAAAVATLLIALDMGLSTRAAVPMTVAVVDRLGAVAILWGLAAAIAWRKRRDAMIEHLSAIVESSDDAIIGSTLEGVVTSVNAGAERLFDVAAADVVGRRVE